HNASRAPHPRRRGAGLPRRAAGAARQERVSQESTTPGQRPGAASAARDCEADEEAARGLPQGCPPGSSLPRTPVRGTILVDVFNPNPFMWGAQRAAMAPDAPRRSPEPKKRRRAGGAEAPGAEALDPQPAAPPAEGPAAAEGDVAAPAPAAAAAGLGGGEGRPAAGGRGLPEVLAAWEALQPRLAELRGAAAAQRAGWQELLRSAQRAAARTDAELAAEQAELGERRYGPRASHFCTLPPSVALLVQLGAHNPEEAAFARELEAACGAVAEVKGQLLALVKAAKDRDDRDALRDLGPRLAVLSKEMKALGGLDGDVGKRLTVASRRVTQYRSGQEVRTVEPDGLGHVEPSFNGYIKILDYYRCAMMPGRACITPSPSAEWTPWGLSQAPRGGGSLRRRVWRTDWARPTAGSTTRSSSCAPSSASASAPGRAPPRAGAAGPCSSWSKKPLCASCSDVCRVQLPRLLPGLRLEVVVDEASAEVGVCGGRETEQAE
ncbi:unnamed protein product, partial [Prorocentrum cordatum]